MIDSEGELYTWGNNTHRCLGRPTADNCDFLPGRVECFNTVVDSNPRGKVGDVACGKYFTIATTLPCEEDILIRAAKLHEMEAMDAVAEDLNASAGGRTKEVRLGTSEGREEKESQPAEEENGMGGEHFDTAPPEQASTANRAVSFKSEWDASDSDEEP